MVQIPFSKKELYLCFISFLLISAFVATIESSSLIAATAAPSDAPKRPGTTVSWAKEKNSTLDTMPWTNNLWEFGPFPTYNIYLSNGTKVTDSNFIPLNRDFMIVINVQKSIFTGNETLGGAGLNWNTQVVNMTNPQQVLGNANARIDYINYLSGEKAMSLPPDWKNGSFTLWSQTYNSTAKTVQAPSVVIGKPGDVGSSMMQPPPQASSFYIFNRAASYVNESASSWIIHIVGKFNSSTTFQGPYNVNIEVFDSHQNSINFGYMGWSGMSSPSRMIAVGRPGLTYGQSNEFWTFGKYDMENQTVYSVARGSSFTMQVNVTSSSLSNVTLGLDTH